MTRPARGYQQHDHDLIATLAQGLQSRDLSIGELVGGDEDAGSAIGTLRQGIGHVAELVQAIERTASGVASSSLEMAQTTVGGRASTEVAGSLTQLGRGASVVHAVSAARESAEQVGAASASSAESARRTTDAAQRVQQAAGGRMPPPRPPSPPRPWRLLAERPRPSAGWPPRSATSAPLPGADLPTSPSRPTGAQRRHRSRPGSDSSRGFAVVAEEVRKLAEESSRAAAAISNIVQEIPERTRLAGVGGRGPGPAHRPVGRHRRRDPRRLRAHQRGGAGDDPAVEDILLRCRQIAQALGDSPGDGERRRRRLQASSATEHASAATQQSSGLHPGVLRRRWACWPAPRRLQALVGTFRLTSA